MMQQEDHKATEVWTPITSLKGLGCGGVYAARHEPSGQVLISASADMARRVWDQRQRLKAGRHFNSALQADYDADPDSIRFYVVQKSPLPLIRKLVKKHYLDAAKAGGRAYNISPVRL